MYHRTSFKLKKKHTKNAQGTWIRCNGAFEAVVAKEQFEQAQRIILERSRKLTDDEMLGKLRELRARHPHISGLVIDEQENFPSSSAYQHRFGSLIRAYQLIGYTPEIDYSFIEINRRLRAQHPHVVAEVKAGLEGAGATAIIDPSAKLLTVNGEFSVSIVLCRHTETLHGSSRWLVRLDASARADITVVVRMDATNEAIRDYFLFPALDISEARFRMAEHNGIYLDTYRFDTLEYLFHMAKRTTLKEAA